jgi:hypothetical protein
VPNHLASEEGAALAEAREGRDPARQHVRFAAGPLLRGAVALPPLVAALGLTIGFGLARGVAAPVALVSALALTSLPILGLTTLLGGRAVTATWLWSLCLYLALPVYFPGERADAAARGAAFLASPLGAVGAEQVGRVAGETVGVIGKDPVPISQRTAAPLPLTPATSAPTDDLVAGTPDTTPTSYAVPYDGDEHSLRIPVDADGPDIGETFEMIFDTGATFTTLSHAALAALDFQIDPDAPWASLRTANGMIRAPLVLIDAFWLGGAVVEWITVAVCDSCANPPAVGLLGLNVSRQFRVSLDHDLRQIELSPRERRVDRLSDVDPWLAIESQAIQHWTGAVDLELTGRNRSHREIEFAVINLDCNGDGFAIQLDRIPAHGERTTTLSLPRGTRCGGQSSIALARARWRLDRF